MSITIIDSKDIIALVKNSQCPGPQTLKNFFDFFGTSGCLLNCEKDKTLDQARRGHKSRDFENSKQVEKRKGGSVWKNSQANYRTVRQEWFTATMIASSVSQGCGSCGVLRHIIEASFFGNTQILSDQFEYAISQDLELRRRPIDAKEPVETIRLFQPPALPVRFERLPVSNYLNGRNTSIERLRGWIGDCLNNHESCVKQDRAQNNGILPARLLDLTPIQRHQRSGVKLIETKSGESYQYACLSHRWNPVVDAHKTTTSNLAQFLDFIDLEKLPKNFSDAILIARDLRIHYLWIDSLCIIQQGDGGNDKLREIAIMGSIYQNARLTILAMSSPSSDDGCFINDQWPDLCFSICGNPDRTYLFGARVLDRKGRPLSTADLVSRYTLLTRGWVFQERLLSPRLLQCDYGEFSFECLTSSHCECNSHLAPHPDRVAWWANAQNFTHRRRLFLQGVQGSLNFSERDGWKGNALAYWDRMVMMYMQLKLSDNSDVLPAVAGCARILAKHLGYNYVAGLWEETLSSGLLWYIKVRKRGAKPEPRPDPKETTAPSWSWASVSMGQSISHFDCSHGEEWATNDLLLRHAIKEVHCPPESALNAFGKLKSGAFLRFHAQLYPWFCRLFCMRTLLNSSSRGRWTHDLHVERSTLFAGCGTTETPPLAIGDADVEIRFDAHLRGEGLDFTNFSQCISTRSRPCGLAQVFLLHAVRKEGRQRSFDAFLVLRRIASVEGRLNCYKRLGLMQLANKSAEGEARKWEDIVRGRIKPVQEEFYLY